MGLLVKNTGFFSTAFLQTLMTCSSGEHANEVGKVIVAETATLLLLVATKERKKIFKSRFKFSAVEEQNGYLEKRMLIQWRQL